MTSLLLLNNFYPLIYRRVQREVKATISLSCSSVTRYGPRTSCQRDGLNKYSYFNCQRDNNEP